MASKRGFAQERRRSRIHFSPTIGTRLSPYLNLLLLTDIHGGLRKWRRDQGIAELFQQERLESLGLTCFIDRWFSPRECARLMGFPESFKLYPKEKDTYAQLGNAVTPPIIAIVGGSCVAALRRVQQDDCYITEVNRAALKLVLDATGISNKAGLLQKRVVIYASSSSIEVGMKRFLEGGKEKSVYLSRYRMLTLVTAWVLISCVVRR